MLSDSDVWMGGRPSLYSLYMQVSPFLALLSPFPNNCCPCKISKSPHCQIFEVKAPANGEHGWWTREERMIGALIRALRVRVGRGQGLGDMNFKNAFADVFVRMYPAMLDELRSRQVVPCPPRMRPSPSPLPSPA